MKHCILNPNILIVLGKVNATIVDAERERTYLIPLVMGRLILNSPHLDINELIKMHGNSKELHEYIQFLKDKDLIIQTKFSYLYVKHNFRNYYDNCIVKNLILDIGINSKINVIKFAQECDKVYCRNLQIRIIDKLPISKVKKTLDAFKYSALEFIEIFLKYEYPINELKKIFNGNTRIKKIIVFNKEKTEIPFSHKSGHKSIIFLNKELNERSCGDIESRFFISKLNHISESYNYNSCLNSKLSIDINGNIKNCPSMKEAIGNINEIGLLEAVENPKIQKYWKINKDQIKVCKDCEFRFVCTDCRAYLEDTNDIYSKPLKCGYDPYTGEWSEWSTNPLKQKSIEYYNMQELVKERQKNLDNPT